jgi:acetyltransferase-like isoleucine patch superfamily enzyme
MFFGIDLLPSFVRNIVFTMVMQHYGKNSFIDYRAYFRYPWKISIGDNVAVNRGCEFYPSIATSEGRITLEDGVVLGPAVKLFAATHDYSRLDLPDTSAPITIKRFAWIGGGAIILPGVTIGEGAVIGAGSVVTRDVEPFTLNAGNPARFIKRREVTVPDHSG